MLLAFSHTQWVRRAAAVCRVADRAGHPAVRGVGSSQPKSRGAGTRNSVPVRGLVMASFMAAPAPAARSMLACADQWQPDECRGVVADGWRPAVQYQGLRSWRCLRSRRAVRRAGSARFLHPMRSRKLHLYGGEVHVCLGKAGGLRTPLLRAVWNIHRLAPAHLAQLLRWRDRGWPGLPSGSPAIELCHLVGSDHHGFGVLPQPQLALWPEPGARPGRGALSPGQGGLIDIRGGAHFERQPFSRSSNSRR